MIDLVKLKSREKGRVIGLCPETKHPTYHDSIGRSLEQPLVRILRQNGYSKKSDPCIIQSFEVSNLKELRRLTNLRLLQLFDEPHLKPADVVAEQGMGTYADMMKPAGLKKIKEYAWGVGPWKENIMPRDKQNRLSLPNALMQNAHAVGLRVVVYTMRNEKSYLADDYDGDPKAEYRKWFQMGVDGVFTDFPDTAVEAARTLVRCD